MLTTPTRTNHDVERILHKRCEEEAICAGRKGRGTALSVTPVVALFAACGSPCARLCVFVVVVVVGTTITTTSASQQSLLSCGTRLVAVERVLNGRHPPFLATVSYKIERKGVEVDRTSWQQAPTNHHIHTYIHTYRQTDIHTYIHIYIAQHMQVHVRTYY